MTSPLLLLSGTRSPGCKSTSEIESSATLAINFLQGKVTCAPTPMGTASTPADLEEDRNKTKPARFHKNK